MMRVVHVLNDLSGGGAERLVLEFCRRSAPDVHTRVVTVHAGGVLAAAFADAGVEVRSVGRRRGRLGLRALARLAGELRGADVVHTHLWSGDVYGRVAARLAGVPVVISHEHNVPRLLPDWKVAVKVQTAGLCDRVIAVSESVAGGWRARGLGVDRLVVVPNGIELGRFAGEHVGGGGVLFVGRLVPQKGVEVLLSAMRLLPEASATVVGDGPLRGELDVPGNVEMVGAVEDVVPWLRRADVVVVPSRWEGFGLVAAEAMAAGVPVVASAVDGLVEVVGDAGVLVTPDDDQALARALSDLLANPARRASLARSGRDRVRAFSLEGTITSIEALYRDLRAL